VYLWHLLLDYIIGVVGTGLLRDVHQTRGCTAMKKLRIVILGFGTSW
jgi:hypothetical protein